MKEFLGVIIVLTIIVGGIFFALLSQAVPDNAPHETVTIELSDTYEK